MHPLEPPTTISQIQIYYTADKYTPDPPCPNVTTEEGLYDCTCTNSYGEPTEHGHGYSEQSGWIDLNWSRSQLHDSYEDVDPEYLANNDPQLIAQLIVGEVLKAHNEPDDSPLWADYMTVDELLMDTIQEQLGAVEGDHPSYYATDPDVNYYTGEEVMLAAHVHNY